MPWLPLDTQVVTRFHLKHKKIPATFPMANPDRVFSKQDRKDICAKAKLKQAYWENEQKVEIENEEDD